MTKKRIAKKATPTKRPLCKIPVSKRTLTQAAALPIRRESLKTIEKWPAAELLLEQAHASQHLAETLRQNMLTTDPNCPLRLPTVRGNYYAIQEAFDRVLKAYAIDGPFPNTRYPAMVRVTGTCVFGWGHRVAMPARNLILAINGLLIYCEREPLTRDSPMFGPNESPRKLKPVAGRKRKNDGLPIEWLKAVVHLAETMESEIMKTLPPKPRRKKTGDGSLTEADIELGRNVLATMAKNPSVEQFRILLRKKGWKGGNDKPGKMLRILKAERK